MEAHSDIQENKYIGTEGENTQVLTSKADTFLSKNSGIRL